MIPVSEREVERLARQQARYQRRLWRGPVAIFLHLIVWLLSVSRITLLIGLLARQVRLDVPHLIEIDVPVANLPPALADLRIGLLSDFHIGPHFSPAEARRAVDLLQSAAPDLIVMAGDLIDHRPRDTVPGARVMAGLSARYGVYGILGNHDHRVIAKRLLAALSEHAPNLRMLVNAAVPVPIGEVELWVAGLDSVFLGLADPVAALEHVPLAAPCLLLTHEPDAADYLPRSVTLVLAGHAHGGQIRWRGRPLLLPPLGRYHHGGLRRSKAGPIYTSRGVGWTGLPLRLGCPAEVTVLRLVKAA